jgi:hypothetical protein
MNRLLMAMAFLPTGLVKATGQRFTSIPTSDPVGFFFEAMYRTGPFWVFIGFVQVIAAILLLVPHTAALGAVVLFPVALSIFLITWGVGFHGTVWVTAGMLLSATYLIFWDADRIWEAASRMFGRRGAPPLLEGAGWLERIGWALGGCVGIAFFLTTRSLIPSSLRNELLWAGLAAFAMVATGWILTLVRAARERS